MTIPDDAFIEAQAGSSMKRIANYASPKNGEQTDFWQILGDTQAVVSATGDCFVRPGKAVDEAQRKGRESAGAPDLGKSGPTFAKAGAARYKGPARIVAAKHGNALIVTRRRKD